MHRLLSVLTFVLLAVGLSGARLSAQETPPLFGSWAFDESTLSTGIGQRWRFDVGDPGNAYAVRDGRLEYSSTQAGIRLLGWVSPSSSERSFTRDWTAEVTLTNDTRPTSGFTYAGLETYVNSTVDGSVTPGAYYSLFLKSDASGRSVVAEWGRWNAGRNDFDRFGDAFATVPEGEIRARLVWRAATRSLALSYSFDGRTWLPLKTFQLAGVNAPPTYPASEGMGIELSGVSFGAATVAPGQITFDDFLVAAPAPENPPFYGTADFTGETLPVAIGQRWRFDAGDNGHAYTMREGRLEYTAPGNGLRWLGWVSPSSSGENYLHDWTAEITVSNDTTPTSGFTYAGWETYTLFQQGTVVGSSAYYGIYLRSNAEGKAIIGEWGKWNAGRNDFDRFTQATPIDGTTGPVRLRLSWTAATKRLVVSWRPASGGTFSDVRTFELAGNEAPLGEPWSSGMGLETAGVNRSGAPVSAGQITFDDVVVSGAARNAPLHGADTFNDNDLPVAIGERWRFNTGNTGNSLVNRNGRIEYESTQDGLRFLGWVSPSSSFNNFLEDWSAEVTATNDTVPANGFIAAGLESYALSSSLGPVGNSAYYGVYLSAFGGSRSIISERGRWNPAKSDYDRVTEAHAVPSTGPIRLRLEWRSASRSLALSWSADRGATWTLVKTYALDADAAPLGPPWSNGLGIQFVANNRSGSSVLAGQITFDDMVVYKLASDDTGGFFGRDDFADGTPEPGRYTVAFGRNGATWVESGGRLNFLADASSPTINNTNQAEQAIRWSSTTVANPSRSRSWTAEATFSVRRAPVSVNAAALLGLQVFAADNPNLNYGIYIVHATSGARVSTVRGTHGTTPLSLGLLGSSGNLDPNFIPEGVRLRIAYDSGSGTLTSAFSLDGGTTWQDYSTYNTVDAFPIRRGGNAREDIARNWTVSPANGFGLRIYGTVYGDGVAPGPVLALGDATVDDLVVAVRPRTYETWLEDRLTVAQRADQSLADRAADPDGDGVTNFAAYVLGGSPLSRGLAGSRPVASLETPAPGQQRLAVTFRRVPTPYLLVGALASDTPGSWQPINADVSSFTGTDGLETVTVRDPASLDGQSRRFIQVELRELR